MQGGNAMDKYVEAALKEKGVRTYVVVNIIKTIENRKYFIFR